MVESPWMLVLGRDPFSTFPAGAKEGITEETLPRVWVSRQPHV